MPLSKKEFEMVFLLYIYFIKPRKKAIFPSFGRKIWHIHNFEMLSSFKISSVYKTCSIHGADISIWISDFESVVEVYCTDKSFCNI